MKSNTKPTSGYTVVKEGDMFCLYAPSGDKVADFDTRREAMAKMKELMKEETAEGSKNNKAEDQAEGEY